MKLSMISSFLISIASIGPVACVDNNRSFVIMFAVPPNDSCEYEFQEMDSASMLSYGRLDLAFIPYNGSPSYWMKIQVHNNLLNNSSTGSSTSDTMAIQLDTIRVTYRWLQGADVIARNHTDLAVIETGPPFDSPVSGIVGSAADLETPGRLLIGLVAVPTRVGKSLMSLQADATYVVLGAQIQIIGRTLGGMRMESNTFTFPIYLYNGATHCPAGSYPACIPGQDDFNQSCGS